VQQRQQQEVINFSTSKSLQLLTQGLLKLQSAFASHTLTDRCSANGSSNAMKISDKQVEEQQDEKEENDKGEGGGGGLDDDEKEGVNVTVDKECASALQSSLAISEENKKSIEFDLNNLNAEIQRLSEGKYKRASVAKAAVVTVQNDHVDSCSCDADDEDIRNQAYLLSDKMKRLQTLRDYHHQVYCFMKTVYL
jgi:hypothetical protein